MIKHFISKGYERVSPKRQLKVTYFSPIEIDPYNTFNEEKLVSHLLNRSIKGVGIIFPTFIDRGNIERVESAFKNLLIQIKDINKKFSDLPIVLFAGVQWKSGQEEESIFFIKKFIDYSILSKCNVSFVGLSLEQNEKVFTLNTVFKIASKIELIGVAWIDDDVTLGKGCLQALIARYLDKGAKGSVGAQKIPQPKSYQAAKFLHFAKLRMKTPETTYPHGCCMIIDSNLVRKRIPYRYTCDDGFFCFSQINTKKSNPIESMEIAPNTFCYHYVGGPLKEIYWRVRRSLLNAIVFLADYPTDVSWFYFSKTMFAGLWPIVPLDTNAGFFNGIKKCILKWIYFIWFCQVSIELFFRGILKKPMGRIKWASYSKYKTPSILN